MKKHKNEKVGNSCLKTDLVENAGFLKGVFTVRTNS